MAVNPFNTQNQSNTKVTAATVLGAVTSAATAIGSVFDTATKSVDMANKAVDMAAKKQAIRHKIELHTYQSTLIKEKAIEAHTLNKQINEFLQEEPELANNFQKEFDALNALFDKSST